jgi:hypothetical protein
MSFDPNNLPSMDEIWGWHEELGTMCPRYTGNQAHKRFTDWLWDKFDRIHPKFDLRVERMTFNRWEAVRWSLSIQQDPTGPSQDVEVSYFYPYSGTTDSKGITAKLVDLGGYTPGWYTPLFWERARGAIALVRVPPSTFSLDIGQLPTDAFEPGRPSLESVIDYELHGRSVTNPVFQGMLATVPLLEARRCGVRGVICVWTGMSDALVANQYNPITTGYPNNQELPLKDDPGCPALWVGDRTGQRLAEAAKIGQPIVTLTLEASIEENATTNTLWGCLPGSGPDHECGLIVNTHTDGPSVPEDNGPLGMLALARYFAQRQRNRDLYFVMATGHFQLPQFMQWIPTDRFVGGNDATSLWMVQYPEIYKKKALAGLSMEHLGCTMWADDANGHYGPTGAYEWGTTYTTQKEGSPNPSNLEQQAYLEAVAATNSSGAIDQPVVTVLPFPIFFGEGAPLYAGGLGTVSLCPVPSYLLQAGPNLDKLDKRLIYGQIQTFARTISTLDAKPAEEF